MFRNRCVRACVLAVASLVAFSGARAAGPRRETGIVYLSPVPGARGILPQSNVIVRFAGAAMERGTSAEVTVVGSQSGAHAGALTIAKDGMTLVFKPAREFAWGERVTVVVSGPPGAMSGPAPLTSYSFDIAAAPPPRIANSIAAEITGTLDPDVAVKSGGAATDGLQQLADADPPAINSVIYGVPTPGALFLSSFFSLSAPPAYLLIVNDFGVPYFYRSMPAACLDFKLQPNGLPTYYDNDKAKYYLMDSTYAVTDSFECGNGYTTDLHELRVLLNGHALLLSYDPQTVDMSAVVPGGNPAATVVGAVIQELDENKNVVFQWRSWDHFQITDATHEDLTAAHIDYVHANALELDTDGNILLSSRHMDEITKIDHTTGDILWRMGGKNNQFKFVGDPDGYSHQHAIRRLANGHLILFDNGNFHTPQYSRAVEYQVDEDAKIVQLAWQYRNNPDTYGLAMGFAQRLDDGCTLVSWGLTSPALTQVAPDGTKVLEMNLPPGSWTYRSFRESWLGDTTSVLDAPRGPILLSPLSPNPTRGTTSLVVNLLRESSVSARLFDLNGRMVQDVAESARHAPGLYRVQLDLSGSAPGMYFLKLAAGRQIETRKIVRLR